MLRDDFMEKESVYESNLRSAMNESCRKVRDFLQNSEGTILYGMKNPYMFRTLLQRKPGVLRELIRDLLSIPPEQEIRCRIMNPIVLGWGIRKRQEPLHTRIQIADQGTKDIILHLVRKEQDIYLEIYFQKKYSKDMQRTSGRSYPFSGEGDQKASDYLHPFIRLFSITNWTELREFMVFSPVYRQYAEALAELNSMPEVILQCLFCENRFLENCFLENILGTKKQLQFLAAEQRIQIVRQQNWILNNRKEKWRNSIL